MIKKLIKKLALKYTNLTYPVDTESPTLNGLRVYLKLRKVVEGRDYREEGYIEVSGDFYDAYDRMISVPNSDGAGAKSLFFRNIPLTTKEGD